MIEKWTDAEYDKLKCKGIPKILKELKLNVNLVALKFSSSQHLDIKFEVIENELQINRDNLDTRNNIRDSGESLSVEVRLSEIKLCLGFNIQLKLDDS